MQEIKPCPFCGQNTCVSIKRITRFTSDGSSYDYMAVNCADCQFEGPGYGILKWMHGSEEKMIRLAVHDWNKRI